MGIRSEGFNAEQSPWLEALLHRAAPTSRTREMDSNRKIRIIKTDRKDTVTAECKGLPEDLLTTAKCVALDPLVLGKILS